MSRDAGRRALVAALARRGVAATVHAHGTATIGSSERSWHRPVSRSSSRRGMGSRCCAAALRPSSGRDHPDVEVLIVDNDSREEATLAFLARCRHTVVRAPGPIQLLASQQSRRARNATGRYLLFLNDDTEPCGPDWLRALEEHAQRPRSAPSARSCSTPTVVSSTPASPSASADLAGHPFRFRREAPDEIRDVSAVTAACLMMRREVFEAVSGFDERLPVNSNDVDLCLRLRARGSARRSTRRTRRSHHYESQTRGALSAAGRRLADDAALARRSARRSLLQSQPRSAPRRPAIRISRSRTVSCSLYEGIAARREAASGSKAAAMPGSASSRRGAELDCDRAAGRRVTGPDPSVRSRSVIREAPDRSECVAHGRQRSVAGRSDDERWFCFEPIADSADRFWYFRIDVAPGSRRPRWSAVRSRATSMGPCFVDDAPSHRDHDLLSSSRARPHRTDHDAMTRGDDLIVRLDASLPATLAVGRGHVLYLTGRCYHRGALAAIVVGDGRWRAPCRPQSLDGAVRTCLPTIRRVGDDTPNSLVRAASGRPFRSRASRTASNRRVGASRRRARRRDAPARRRSARSRSSARRRCRHPARRAIRAADPAREPQVDDLSRHLQSRSRFLCGAGRDSIIAQASPGVVLHRQRRRLRARPAAGGVCRDRQGCAASRSWPIRPASVTTAISSASSPRVPPDVDFVALADQDDVWYPEKLTRTLAAFRPETTLVYADMDVVAPDGTRMAPTYWTSRTQQLHGPRESRVRQHRDRRGERLSRRAARRRAALSAADRRRVSRSLDRVRGAHPGIASATSTLHCTRTASIRATPSAIRRPATAAHADASRNHGAPSPVPIRPVRLMAELWRRREVYGNDVVRLIVMAKILLLRMGATTTAAKRAVLERIAGLERTPLALVRETWDGVARAAPDARGRVALPSRHPRCARPRRPLPPPSPPPVRRARRPPRADRRRDDHERHGGRRPDRRARSRHFASVQTPRSRRA